MKFACKKIEIDADSPFGCTVTFYDRKQDVEDEMNMTTQEIIDSIGQYIMLQRTYPEDEFETDYYYIESSDSKISGELRDYRIYLSRSLFSIELDGQKIEISISPIEKKFLELKRAIENIVNNRGTLEIKV